jgi:hypothetical protein
MNVTRKRIRFNFDLNPFINKSKQVTTLGSELLQNTAFKISLASIVGLETGHLGLKFCKRGCTEGKDERGSRK